jgi:triosephosphate isomerase
MRRRLSVGNWKMNGSRAANAQLLRALKPLVQANDASECVVCVPFPYLAQAGEELHGSAIAWGAQDLSEHDSGAFTGEVSGAMLADLGCRYVIVGHSERRTLHAEADAQVAAKMRAAIRHGLTPIVCVGETLAERERSETAAVVSRQLNAVISAQGIAALAGCVLAYEPVWAIGTGRTASPEQAQEVHALLRQRVAAADKTVAQALPILYGGSVKGNNAMELFAMPDVDGGLVGGASLQASDFAAICEAAASPRN